MRNDAHRDGKPKSGYHGWPLDMKNLPSHLLPKMDEQTVGIYEAQIEHLINPPACSACPFYAKVRGSHYCGLKFCHQRKSMAWEDYSVELANKQTKIAVYEETDGMYRALGYSDNKLFDKRHKDLRLIAARKIGNTYQNIKGLDDGLVVVVATGAALSKINNSGNGSARGGKKTEKEKAEMRAMKIYRVKRKELLWAFTTVSKSLFDTTPLPVLEWFMDRKYLGVDQRPPVEKPDEKDATYREYQCRLVVWSMIEDQSSNFTRETLTDILSGLVEFTKGWKVKVPASLARMAEAMDAEIESVSMETGKAQK
jgi:hypothetical protein